MNKLKYKDTQITFLPMVLTTVTIFLLTSASLAANSSTDLTVIPTDLVPNNCKNDLLPDVWSPQTDQALTVSAAENSLPPELLEAFTKMQRSYRNDPSMKVWERQEQMNDKEYDRRTFLGRDIPGPIVGFGASLDGTLVDLDKEFPSLRPFLTTLIPMKWEGKSYYDLPVQYQNTLLALPKPTLSTGTALQTMVNRPFEIAEDPAWLGNFSHVTVKRKVFIGRGFIPIKEKVLMRFSITLTRNFEGEDSMEIKASGTTTPTFDVDELFARMSILFPENQLNRRGPQSGLGRAYVTYSSGHLPPTQWSSALVELIGKLTNYLSQSQLPAPE